MTRAVLVRRLPWALGALALALLVASGVLGVLQVGSSGSPGFPAWKAVTMNAVTFGAVGFLIASRRPGNAIGWLFLGIGVASALQLVTGEYATYDRYVLHDRLVGTAVSAWVSQLAVVMLFATVPFVLMLFPDGRFGSARWPVAAWFAGTGGLLSTAAAAVSPAELSNTVGIQNPFGAPVHGLALMVINVLGPLPLIISLLVGVASLVMRWRGAGGEQRQQVKWVAFAAAAGFGGIILSILLSPFVGGWLADFAWTVGAAIVPLAAGVSILRYRLYDIDRIVSRTVSYATVTGLLVATYVGLVTAVSRFTPSSSSLSVAASTLAVAALFQPLRRRVQTVVDQHFNRARYDAARTVEEFSLRLREEVDLEAVRDDLLAVIRQTLQPTSTMLWLRSSEGRTA